MSDPIWVLQARNHSLTEISKHYAISSYGEMRNKNRVAQSLMIEWMTRKTPIYRKNADLDYFFF